MLNQLNEFHIALMKTVESVESEIKSFKQYIDVKYNISVEDVAVIWLYWLCFAGFSIKTNPYMEINKIHGQFMQILESVFALRIQKGIFCLCPSIFMFSWLKKPKDNPLPEDPDVISNMFLKGLLRDKQAWLILN